MDPRWRERIRHAAERVGLEPQLKRAAAVLDPMSRRINRDHDHMRVLIASVLDRDSNAIDIGAHSGEILTELLRCAPDGKHMAFEPIPELASRLSSSFPAVDVRNAAVSSSVGRAQFHWVPDAPEQSGLREASGSGGEKLIDVEVVTLDSALPEEYVPRLIKIDVEGAEVEVVRGALETLRRHRPVVVFEFGLGGADRYGHTARDMYDLLTGDAGMRIYDIDGRGPYSAAEFDDVFDQPLWNFVARA